MVEWHENDDLWTASRPGMFPASAFDAAAVEVAAILALVGCSSTLDILDLPCGPGRHAFPLARVGHRVVAVDRTPSYIEELRARVD